MSWYAFDAVDDALAATRRFLLPFSLGRWSRIALVVLFLGTGGVGSSFNVPSIPSTPTDPGPTEPTPVPTDPTPDTGFDPANAELLLLGVIALVLVVLAVALVFAVVGPVMRFVFVDMLRTDEVRIRRWFGTRLGKGLRLLGFRIGTTLLVALPFAVVGALFLLLDMGTGLGIVGIVLLLLVAIPVVLLFGVFSSFTTQFVVPVMVVADTGVIAGWKRFWPTLRAHPWQFLVYLVTRWVLALGVGLATGVALGILGGIVVVAALIVGFLAVGTFGGLDAALASTPALVILGIVVLLTLLVLFVLSLALSVPVRSFLTTYELSVLGRAEPQFVLLPETGDGDDGDGLRRVGGGKPVITRRDGVGGRTADESGRGESTAGELGADTDGPGSTDDGPEGGGNEFAWGDVDGAAGDDDDSQRGG